LEVAAMTLIGSINWMISHVVGYFDYRRTLHDLSSMSDQQLRDVGLVRGHIDDVARGALRMRVDKARSRA
jgi:uncharacterized protein YjiS (DUF1127 family)